MFSVNAENAIEEAYETNKLNSLSYSDILKSTHLKSIYLLKHLKDCINQTIGDAISDMLIIELILLNKNLTIEQWNQQYTDLPNRQLKLCVKDRNYLQTTDADRRLLKPEILQIEIDSLVKTLQNEHDDKVLKLRTFVRPSGTEDVVRIYAESITQVITDELANRVARIVYDLADGVGARP